MENQTSIPANQSEAYSIARKNLETSSMRKKIKFLRKGLAVGILTEILFLSIQDIRTGTKLRIAIDFCVTLIFIGTYFASFRTKQYKTLFNLVILAVTLSIIVSFYDQTAMRAIFLTPVSTLVAYLLLSRKGGFLWTFLLCSMIIGVYTLDRAGIAQSHLDTSFTLFGILSAVVVSALLYIYEGINVINEHLLVKRDIELSEVNEKLNQQLENNKKTADELARTLQTTQKNNQMLHDSKLAIMNVLEDANNLQVQLRLEKENVEKVVSERTTELRFEQARLRASINSVESGLLMIFSNNQEAIFNPALLELLSLEVTDPRVKNLKTDSMIKLMQEVFGDSYAVKDAIEDCQNNLKPFNVDTVQLGEKFIRVRGAPILSKEGKEALGCVIIMEDQTEARLLERSKDEFISIASHELRTPLTAIRGNAYMLVNMFGDQLPSGDVKDMIADIKDASVRLIGIVNQFLSTSRLEQKRTVFTLKPVDISLAIKACLKELEELAHEKDIVLSCHIAPNLPEVLADSSRVGEIIINVVGNAIKYTPKGKVTVTARTLKDCVEVDVEDTGNGIDPKNQDLLFHKFQQTTSNILTRDDSRSTGLGLYITKLLTEQMGGSIYLKHSEIGKGSTFTFTLPIAHKEAVS